MLLSSFGASPESPFVILDGEPVSRLRDFVAGPVSVSDATCLVGSRLEGTGPSGALRFAGMVENGR